MSKVYAKGPSVLTLDWSYSLDAQFRVQYKKDSREYKKIVPFVIGLSKSFKSLKLICFSD